MTTHVYRLVFRCKDVLHYFESFDDLGIIDQIRPRHAFEQVQMAVMNTIIGCQIGAINIGQIFMELEFWA